MDAKSICGVKCAECGFIDTCKGCLETNGQPFGAECIVALYHQKGPKELDTLKKRLNVGIKRINRMGWNCGYPH